MSLYFIKLKYAVYAREQLKAVGVVLLRFPPAMNPNQKAELVARLVVEQKEQLFGKISVLTQQNVRIRPLPQQQREPGFEIE